MEEYKKTGGIQRYKCLRKSQIRAGPEMDSLKQGVLPVSVLTPCTTVQYYYSS